MLENRISEAVEAKWSLDAARDAYAAAVVAALEAGVSVAALAAELGLTRQAVNAMRLRHAKAEPAVTDEQLDARIAEIQDWWTSKVEEYASQWDLRPTGKLQKGALDADTAAQNHWNAQSGAKKLRRRAGRTVKGDRFAFAERRLLQEIHEHRDVAVVRVALGNLAVLDELLVERERRNDLRF